MVTDYYREKIKILEKIEDTLNDSDNLWEEQIDSSDFSVVGGASGWMRLRNDYKWHLNEIEVVDKKIKKNEQEISDQKERIVAIIKIRQLPIVIGHKIVKRLKRFGDCFKLIEDKKRLLSEKKEAIYYLEKFKKTFHLKIKEMIYSVFERLAQEKQTQKTNKVNIILSSLQKFQTTS